VEVSLQATVLVLPASVEASRDRELLETGKRRATVVFRPNHSVILVYPRLASGSVALEEGFTRDMRGVGDLGTGDLEVRIESAEDLDKAGLLVRLAFEAA
jgi:predicted transport protein